MHYTIVTETYPPEINGVALTVQSLEEGLRERGHIVSVIRPKQTQDSTPAPHERLFPSIALPVTPVCASVCRRPED